MPISEKDLIDAVDKVKEKLFNKAHFPKSDEMFVLYLPEIRKVLGEMVDDLVKKSKSNELEDLKRKVEAFRTWLKSDESWKMKDRHVVVAKFVEIFIKDERK
jgi:hypothetical protein